jgi:Galactosyltransferase
VEQWNIFGGAMNPRILVAVMTCHKLDYFIDHQTIDWCTQKNLRHPDQQARVKAIRETWATGLGEIPYRFFYGTRLRRDTERREPAHQYLLNILREPLADEVFLNCGDNYTENPAKMKAICRWALDNGYDYILRVDDDTFIYPDRIFKTNWATKDYSGANDKGFHPGGCLFLSRHAMELIIQAQVTTYADDVWIGQVMRDNHIPLNPIKSMRNEWDTGYKVPANVNTEGMTSFHSCTPEVMRVLWGKRDAVLNHHADTLPSDITSHV